MAIETRGSVQAVTSSEPDCLKAHRLPTTVTPRPDRPLPLRACPLLLVAGCFAVGILGAERFASVSFAWWAGVALLAFGSVLLLILRRQRQLVSADKIGFTLALALGILAFGGLRLASWRALPADHLAHLVEVLPDAEVVLTGSIADVPRTGDRSVRFVLDAQSVEVTDTILATRGAVQVDFWRPRDADSTFTFPTLAAGSHVRVRGTLRAPPQRRNPADFDYGTWLRRRGLHTTLTVAPDSASLVVAEGTSQPLYRLANATRAHVRHTLHTHVRHDEARAVLSALLLADRSRIAPDVRETFARTGLMHLLAISGLHVMLVGFALYRLLKPLLHRLGWPWRRVEVFRSVATILALGLYVTATGAPDSAVRAFVMATLLLIGAATERSYNALNALGVAALALLLARPTALFEAGFQLSFAAVGAIVLLMPVLRRPLSTPWITRGWRRRLADMTLASVAATLGTAPVLLVHFGQVPLAGLALNLAAIPATTLTLAAGLFAVVTGGWLPSVADLFGASAEVAALVLLWISRTGATWLGGLTLEGAVENGWWIGALVLALTALAASARPRLRWRLAAATVACAAVATWVPVGTGATTPALDVTFFDVGQGDAALFRFPNGRTLLVDAGLRDPFVDRGERTILPHLRAAGIDWVDAVVVSHPHADHLGGLPSVLRGIAVGRVIHNGHAYDSDLYREVAAVLEERNIASQTVLAGDTLLLDPAVRIHILGPDRAPQPEEEANHGSVVLRVAYGATAFLLTGDAEADAEAALVAHYGDLLASDVVKVAHHGSRTSSTPPFVRHAVGEGAPAAVVSVARRNVYRLPNAEVLDGWATAGATVLQTWAEGAVQFRSDGVTVERAEWR